MRWFAEMLWYPTALLPSQGVRREAVDDHSANATFIDGQFTLTLLFGFNAAGLIGSFRAEASGGMVGDKLVLAPWEGVWSNYQMRDGVQVPFTGEVAWMRPEGQGPISPARSPRWPSSSRREPPHAQHRPGRRCCALTLAVTAFRAWRHIDDIQQAGTRKWRAASDG